MAFGPVVPGEQCFALRASSANLILGKKNNRLGLWKDKTRIVKTWVLLETFFLCLVILDLRIWSGY